GAPERSNQGPDEAGVLDGTHEPLQEIESADVSQITDSSSAELLDELNAKRKKIRYWPIAAVLGAARALYSLGTERPDWLPATIGAVALIGVYLAYQKDLLRKTVVLLYDFDPEMEEAYERLLNSANELAAYSKAWHIEASGAVRDRKYHSGASSIVSRKPTD